MIVFVLILVILALGVGIVLGLALADVRAIRTREFVRPQFGADDEWARFLWKINHHHEPRHAIEAGVT